MRFVSRSLVFGVVVALLVVSASQNMFLPMLEVRGSGLTEWTIPTADSSPFGIVASGSYVYYTSFPWVGGNPIGRIGRLDVTTGSFVEWNLGAWYGPKEIALAGGYLYTATNEGIIRLDPATGETIRWDYPYSGFPNLRGLSISGDYVYFTASTDNTIGRLNIVPGEMIKWKLPVPSNPCDVAVHNGLIYFTTRIVQTVGCIDPSTNIITEWPVPSSIPNGIFISDDMIYYAAEGPGIVGRLDPTTGVFTQWSIPDDPAIPGDPAIEYLYVSGDFVFYTDKGEETIGRLDITTGKLVKWVVPTPDAELMGIDIDGGAVFFTESWSSKIGRLEITSGSTSTIVTTEATTVVSTTSIVTTAAETFLTTKMETAISSQTGSMTYSIVSGESTGVLDRLYAPPVSLVVEQNGSPVTSIDVPVCTEFTIDFWIRGIAEGYGLVEFDFDVYYDPNLMELVDNEEFFPPDHDWDGVGASYDVGLYSPHGNWGGSGGGATPETDDFLAASATFHCLGEGVGSEIRVSAGQDTLTLRNLETGAEMNVYPSDYVITCNQYQQRGPSGPRYVGGELFSATKTAVLAPYLMALFSVVALVVVVVKRKLT